MLFSLKREGVRAKETRHFREDLESDDVECRKGQANQTFIHKNPPVYNFKESNLAIKMEESRVATT